MLTLLISRKKRIFVGQLKDGTKFLGDLLDSYSCVAQLNGEFEPGLCEFCLMRLNSRQGCVIDVGCNVGLFSASLLRRSPRLQVIALEPDFLTAERARGTALLNDFENFEVIDAAAGESSGKAEFHRMVGHSAQSSLGLPDASSVKSQVQEVIEVSLTSLDDVISSRSVEQVLLLKIDAEGHDLQVLKGARHLLASGPDVIFEYHSRLAILKQERIDDYLALLREMGYNRFSLLDHGRLQDLPSNPEGVLNVFCTRD